VLERTKAPAHRTRQVKTWARPLPGSSRTASRTWRGRIELPQDERRLRERPRRNNAGAGSEEVGPTKTKLPRRAGTGRLDSRSTRPQDPSPIGSRGRGGTSPGNVSTRGGEECLWCGLEVPVEAGLRGFQFFGPGGGKLSSKQPIVLFDELPGGDQGSLPALSRPRGPADGWLTSWPLACSQSHHLPTLLSRNSSQICDKRVTGGLPTILLSALIGCALR